MSLQYIVDGYNVLRHRAFKGLGKKADDPCVTLARTITAHHLTGSRKNEVVLVFDGYRPSRANLVDDPGITVVFSCDDSADAAIRRMIERAPNPRVVVVVTDDNEIRFFAREARCAVLGVEEFLNAGARADKGAQGPERDARKADLNFTQMEQINKELRQRWLKEP